jgi:hypothetical protein
MSKGPRGESRKESWIVDEDGIKKKRKNITEMKG